MKTTFSNKGSEWSKWDLHIHTPSSIYQKYGSDDQETWESFMSDIESLSTEFSVLGINDYFFIDGYERLKHEKEVNNRLKNIACILPVIEFRIEKFAGVDFGQLKRINLHVIFSDSMPLETIKSQFLNPLEQSYCLESGDQWTRAITMKSVEELGRKIKSGVPSTELYKYGSDLIVGFNNLNVKEEKIFAALDKDCFKGKHLIAIGKTEWGELKWTDASIATKKSIINRADVVFTAAKSIEDFHRAQNKLKSQGVKDLLLDCSDAHYLSTSTDKDRIGNCFTWIKANPTFEGLKQIIYEPELRVKIQEQNPNQKISYEIIEEVRFICNSNNINKFSPETIKLNPDLNVIIGGKSAGKSLLLYSIANTIDPKQTKEKEEKNTNDIYNFSSENIDFEVKWANNEKKIFSKNSDPSASNYPILYLPQNYIQKLAHNEVKKTRKEVAEIIREILKQKEEYKKYYNDFLVEVKRLDIVRETLIAQYFTSLDAFNISSEDIKKIGDKNAILKNIEEKKLQIEELKKKSTVTEDEQVRYKVLTTGLQQNNLRLFELSNDKQKLENFKYSIDKISVEAISARTILLNELKTETIKNSINEDIKILDEITKISTNIQEKYLKNINGLISLNERDIQLRVSTTNREFGAISSKFANRDDIDKIEKIILNEHDKLNLINKYEEEIKIKRKQKDDIKNELLKEYKNAYYQYINIVEILNKRGSEIKDLTLTGSCKFYTNRFYGRFREYINNTSTRSDLYINIKFPEDKHIANVDNIEDIINWFSGIFDNVIDGKITLKNRITKKDILNALFKDDFFDYWEVKSNIDEIATMSPGKASLVLLKLLIDLSDSQSPILIDQPEDNLDNRSIYTDLVKYIRTKKLERQFIVVTHNPNIVVGADAENVIVANQNDQDEGRKNKIYQFDYINGAIENTSKKDTKIDDILTCMGIREHVTEILEGGKEAFQKRESKYGYS